jgi:acylphosphatase
MVTKLLKISGRVQGVGYRDWMQTRAVALNLAGWVRNRADGTVEALVSGSAETVDVIISACHEGPHFAEVSTVYAEEAGAPDHADFKRFPTF